MAAPTCPTCGTATRLTDGREIYPHRQDLADKPLNDRSLRLAAILNWHRPMVMILVVFRFSTIYLSRECSWLDPRHCSIYSIFFLIEKIKVGLPKTENFIATAVVQNDIAATSFHGVFISGASKRPKFHAIEPTSYLARSCSKRINYIDQTLAARQTFDIDPDWLDRLLKRRKVRPKQLLGITEGIDFFLRDPVVGVRINKGSTASICRFYLCGDLEEKLTRTRNFEMASSQSGKSVLISLLLHFLQLCKRGADCNNSCQKGHDGSRKRLISIEPKLETIQRTILRRVGEHLGYVWSAAEAALRRPPTKAQQQAKHCQQENGEAPIHAPNSRLKLRHSASGTADGWSEVQTVGNWVMRPEHLDLVA